MLLWMQILINNYTNNLNSSWEMLCASTTKLWFLEIELWFTDFHGVIAINMHVSGYGRRYNSFTI